MSEEKNELTFWKVFGASLLAFVATSVLSVIIFIITIISIICSFEFETETIPQKSVLYINLSEDIIDGPLTSAMGTIDPMTFEFTEPVTILETKY